MSQADPADDAYTWFSFLHEINCYVNRADPFSHAARLWIHSKETKSSGGTSIGFQMDMIYQFVSGALPLRTRYFCLMESDVAVDMSYIRTVWFENSTAETLWIQHFWGHTHFEYNNFGLFCARRDVSYRTRVGLYLASRLAKTKWAWVLLPHQIWAWFEIRFGSGMRLGWENQPKKEEREPAWLQALSGCTTYRPGCKYIHYTRPKFPMVLDYHSLPARSNSSSRTWCEAPSIFQTARAI